MYAYTSDSNSEVDPFGLDCGIKNKKNSFEGISRKEAFRKAKRDARIPMSQQPNKVYHKDLKDGLGRTVKGLIGRPIQTRNYEFKGKNNEPITIQEHSLGHTKATTGHGAEPHFNVRPIDNLNTGHVEGTYGHYNFP